MAASREKYDLSAPGTRELVDRIVHGAFVTEGTMVAFPPCFPGVTLPVPADEGHITALDVAPDGIVYAGTSGRAAHLLVGMFHGVTGMVLDMGAVEGADHTAAVCCAGDQVVAAVNGPAGGRLAMRGLQPLPFDLIQEWHIGRKPIRVLDPVAPGERILHAVAAAGGAQVVGVTERHLFVLDVAAARVDLVAELPGRARLARGPGDRILGLDEGAALWAFDPGTRVLQRRAMPLPDGDWALPALMWARDPAGGTLYTADAAGTLYALAAEREATPLARLPVAPAGPMAVTRDGRLFGTMGDEMSRLFCYHPGRRQVTDLGVAVSVFERRRYGYAFGDAAVGRDGEIVFGEDDDLGHLWLYFPRILSRGEHA